MKFVAPDAQGLTRTLEMIAGDSASGKAAAAGPADVAYSGVFVDDDDVVVASCDCDMATAAALGCALSMIPPGGAEGMVEDGELSAMASDNLYECMNMFSSLLMADGSGHLRLVRVERAAPDIDGGPAEAAFALELGRYGKGALRFRYT